MTNKEKATLLAERINKIEANKKSSPNFINSLKRELRQLTK